MGCMALLGTIPPITVCSYARWERLEIHRQLIEYVSWNAHKTLMTHSLIHLREGVYINAHPHLLCSVRQPHTRALRLARD